MHRKTAGDFPELLAARRSKAVWIFPGAARGRVSDVLSQVGAGRSATAGAHADPLAPAPTAWRETTRVPFHLLPFSG